MTYEIFGGIYRRRTRRNVTLRIDDVALRVSLEIFRSELLRQILSEVF